VDGHYLEDIEAVEDNIPVTQEEEKEEKKDIE